MNKKIIGIFGAVALLATLGAGCAAGNQNANTNAPARGKVLDLSNQGLTRVEMSVFNQTDLTELNLSHNDLTGAMLAELRQLQNLEVLNLSDNKFTGVPAEIGQLKKLKILNLSNNQLTGLPYELGNLTQLATLDVSGNLYSEADLAKISSTLPNTQIIK